jgi:predicted esterase
MHLVCVPRYASVMSEPLLRHAAASVHGRYLVQPPSAAAVSGWLVGFHGYAQSAAALLPGLARAAPGGDWLVASVQALHPFYTKSDDVVANWMTREDRELAIADNIGYVDAVCDALEREWGAPRALVFAGFSQGVAMAYRAAVQGRRLASALFTVGGDMPPELRSGGRHPWPRVLMLTGEADAWYTPARLEADVAAARAAGAEVRSHVFAGGHEWNRAVEEALAGLLGELAVGPDRA